MNIAFYTGKTGLIAQQEGLNVYSNNIANVNTVGFKASRPSFADCIYTVQRNTKPDWQTGHGEYVHSTQLMYSEGVFTYTDNDLDFAIPTEEGFFAVMDKYFIEGTSKPDYEALTKMIGVYTFDNNFGLELLGSNKMTATERSGEAVADRSIDKIRMALERSNTDIAGDMVRIIETQRSYQMSARVVQTADELERITNNLRG